jgi:hypothetical protein
MNGSDEPRLSRLFSEGLAELSNHVRQVGLVHMRVGPQLPDEIGL